MHCCRSILIRILLITVWFVSCGGDEAAVETMSTDVGTDGNRATPSEPEAIRPFKVRVPQSVLDDLKTRLARTRFPDEINGAGWDYGANLEYMKDFG